LKINSLTLYTSALEKQVNFYSNTLGLIPINYSSSFAEFKTGRTILKFVQRQNATPYHFAINIPANKDAEALAWLKQRAEILKSGNDELIDFKNWNAKSIYFYDHDKNIVEFIARKNLVTQTKEAFGVNQLLEVSEIGMPVEDVGAAFGEINTIAKVEIYYGSFDKFCAAGDEYGLFIIINKNRKKWFPTNDEAFSSDFILEGEINLEFADGKINFLR
jgi:catechol-2,3-dioxygenase